MFDYNLTVIGGGSGGLVAAQIAARLGAKVALIDRTELGGDCLHHGCVPSKTLLALAHTVYQSRQAVTTAGGLVPPTVDMPRITSTIDQVIAQIGQDEQAYVEGVDVFFGGARFIDPHTIQAGERTITSKRTIIATGSRPALPQIQDVDASQYLTNEDLFDLAALPGALTIIGGGPVACEMGQAFARLGSQVTIVQRNKRLLPREDEDVVRIMHDRLVSEGVTIMTEAQVHAITPVQNQVRITVVDQSGQHITWQTDKVLAAVGREPNVAMLDLDRADVSYSTNGVVVDRYLRTSHPHIFAIGDVIGPPYYTHRAGAHAGVATANALLPGFLARPWKNPAIPRVTFTDPAIASVGLTAVEARARYGQRVRIVTHPWGHIDRAVTQGTTDGMIKLVLDQRDRLLGAHVVGSGASELLGELVIALEQRLTAEQIVGFIHPYPTLTTGIQQAFFTAYLTGRTWQTNRRLVRPFLGR